MILVYGNFLEKSRQTGALPQKGGILIEVLIVLESRWIMRKHFSGSAFARERPYSSGIHRRAAVFFAFCAVAFTLLYLRVGYLSRSPGLAQTARREAQAKIVTLKAQYKAVSEASGLKQRAERMVVEGYTRQQSKEAAEIHNALQFI